MAKILLVDDHEEGRRAVKRVLERLGHTVTEAGNGRSALKAMDTDRPDLLITDLNMPEMDGIELTMAVHGRDPDVPIIAISGGGMLPKELLLQNAAILGALTTLPKPIDLRELEDAVNRALAGGRGGGPEA